MDRKEVNEILKKYDKVIVRNVNKVYMPKQFLNNRCITKDDIYQEVRIRIWYLLEYEYNPEYDLETFIGFQSVKNATWIVNNLYRSSSSFTGSVGNNKRGHTAPNQAKIDNNKILLGRLLFRSSFLDDNIIGKNILTGEEFHDNSYEYYGLEYDYDILVEKMVNLIRERHYKQSYVDAFLILLNDPEYYSRKRIFKLLRDIVGIKSEQAVRVLLKKYRDIVDEVLDEYQNEALRNFNSGS